MADLILGSTTVMTESGGTASLSSGLLNNTQFPDGHVLQVVQQQHTSGAISTASGTPVATGLIASLPNLKSNTNKIFISLNAGESDSNGAGTRYLYFYQSINSASYTAIPDALFGQYIGSTSNSRVPCSYQWLYTPGTTLQVSIQVYMHSSANTQWLTNGRVTTLTLMEIAA